MLSFLQDDIEDNTYAHLHKGHMQEPAVTDVQYQNTTLQLSTEQEQDEVKSFEELKTPRLPLLHEHVIILVPGSAGHPRTPMFKCHRQQRLADVHMATKRTNGAVTILYHKFVLLIAILRSAVSKRFCTCSCTWAKTAV